MVDELQARQPVALARRGRIGELSCMCRMACEDWRRQSRPVPRSPGSPKAGVRSGGTGQSRTLPWISEEKKRLMDSCERSSGGEKEERKERFQTEGAGGRREGEEGEEDGEILISAYLGGRIRGLTDPDLP